MQNCHGYSDYVIPLQPLPNNSTNQWLVASIKICNDSVTQMMQKKRTFWIVVDCPKKGVKLGVFNTAIHGKIVRCSFKSLNDGLNKLLRTSLAKTHSYIVKL